MSTASPADARSAAGLGVDRLVLVSNLLAGALCQLLLVAIGLWPLAVVGAGYVAVGSVILAVAYARETLTPRQEIGSWVVTWLLAVAVWTLIFSEVGMSLAAFAFAFVIGAICFLVWQLAALAVRQLLVSTGTFTPH